MIEVTDVAIQNLGIIGDPEVRYALALIERAAGRPLFVFELDGEDIDEGDCANTWLVPRKVRIELEFITGVCTYVDVFSFTDQYDEFIEDLSRQPVHTKLDPNHPVMKKAMEQAEAFRALLLKRANAYEGIRAYVNNE